MQLQLEKKLVELLLLQKKLVEHRQISRASPFCDVIDILHELYFSLYLW